MTGCTCRSYDKSGYDEHGGACPIHAQPNTTPIKDENGGLETPDVAQVGGNQADNRSEAIKAMSEIPLPWNAVYAPPKHIADVSDLVLKDPEATDE